MGNKIEELNTLLNEEKGKRLQLMADFQNFRKQVEADKAKYGAIANMQIVITIVEILSDIRRSEENNKEESSESLIIIKDKLIDLLVSLGIDLVVTEIGESFNTKTMEAIATVPVSKKKDDGKVVDVITFGFKFLQSDEMVNPSKVVVGKHIQD